MTNAEAAPVADQSSQQTSSPAEGTHQNQQSSGNDVQSIFKPGGVKPAGGESTAGETGQQSQQQSSQQQQQTQQGQQAATQQQQQQQSLDPKAIAKSIVEAQTLAQQQMRQQVAPELTQEQFNQKYGVRSVTTQDVQAILDADPAKAAAHLNTLLDAKVRQAVLMAQGYISPDIEGLKSQLGPMQTYRQQQQERELMSEFKSLHPDLKDEDVLIETFARAYQSRGETFNGDKTLAFTTLAKAVRDQITRLRGGQQGSQQQTQQTGQSQQRQSSRTMTPMQTGGRSGSGPAKQANDIELIFKR